MIPCFEQPVVYFLQAGCDGPVKIGWTTNLPGRVATIQTNHYEKIHLRAVIEDATSETESAVHFEARDASIRGEWFWPSRTVKRLMEVHAWPRQTDATHPPYTDKELRKMADWF